MLVIWDTCNVAVSGEPSGGITLRFGDIEGDEGKTYMVPIARETAEALVEGAQKILGRQVKTFTPQEAKEAVNAGLGKAHS